jgi:hypothetical protein
MCDFHLSSSSGSLRVYTHLDVSTSSGVVTDTGMSVLCLYWCESAHVTVAVPAIAMATQTKPAVVLDFMAHLLLKDWRFEIAYD